MITFLPPGKKVILKMSILLFISFISLAMMTAVALHNLGAALESADWVNHSHAVLDESSNLVNALSLAEAALTRFLLSSKESDKQNCLIKLNQANEHLHVGKGLTQGEPAAHAIFSSIEPLLEQSGVWAHSLMINGSPELMESWITANEENKSRITQNLMALQAQQQKILHERDKSLYQRAQATRWVLYAGALVNLVVVLWMIYLVRDDIAARNRETELLKKSNQNLEQKVAERTQQITEVNARLAFENLETKWAIQSLNHQLKYDNLIIDAVADLVLVVSKDKNISRLNASFIKATGWTPAELIGFPLAKILRSEVKDGDIMPFDPFDGQLEEDEQMVAILQTRAGSISEVSCRLHYLQDQKKIVAAVLTLQPTNRIGRQLELSFHSNEN